MPITDHSAVTKLSILYAVTALFLVRIHGPLVFSIAVGDDQVYYAHSLAVVVNHNLAYRHVPLEKFSGQADGRFQAARYAAGPGWLWSPVLAIGHLLAPWLGVDPQAAAEGTSPIHWMSVCVASMLYGLAGFLFLYRFLQTYFDPSVSFWSVWTVAFSSPLLYYVYRRPLMSHSTEFFALCASAYAVRRLSPESRYPAMMGAGFLTGLLFLCRWTDAPFVASFAAWGAWSLRRAPMSRQSALSRQALFLACVGIAPVAQLLLWKHLTGVLYPGLQKLHPTPAGSSIFFCIHPWAWRHLRDLFIAKDWGIFWLSPVTLMVLLLAPLLRKERRFYGPLCFLAIPSMAILWMSSNWPTHGGEYGNRYLIVTWLLWTFLFAGELSVLRRDRESGPARILIVVGQLALLVSFLMLTLFKSNADTLTLLIGPTRYGLPSDWINNLFAANAWRQVIHHPAQVLLTFGGSVAGYAVFAVLRHLPRIPQACLAAGTQYFYKHRPPDAPPAVYAILLLLAGGLGITLLFQKLNDGC